jgi:hypothetical protein
MAYRCLDGDRGRGERNKEREREEVLLTNAYHPRM